MPEQSDGVANAPSAGANGPLPVAPTKVNLSAGEVIGTTFEVWTKNLAPLLAIALFAAAPALLDQFLFGGNSFAGPWGARPHRGASLMNVHEGFRLLYRFGITFFISAAITEEVREAMRGGSIDLGTSLRVGLNRLLPVIGVSCLTGLGILAGAILFILPAFFLAAMWAVAVPVVVAERVSPVEALGRSRALTRGARWTALLSLFGLGLLVSIVSGIMGFFLIFLGNLGAVITLAIQTGLGSITAVGTAVLYLLLRERKEAAPAEQLADVFR